MNFLGVSLPQPHSVRSLYVCAAPTYEFSQSMGVEVTSWSHVKVEYTVAFEAALVGKLLVVRSRLSLSASAHRIPESPQFHQCDLYGDTSTIQPIYSAS